MKKLIWSACLAGLVAVVGAAYASSYGEGSFTVAGSRGTSVVSAGQTYPATEYDSPAQR